MVPKIQCVCGFGCGSSLLLRMAIDDILGKLGLEAETFTGDVSSCLANECNAIFISQELAERIQDRCEVPLIVINDFMDSAEIESKVKAYFDSLPN